MSSDPLAPAIAPSDTPGAAVGPVAPVPTVSTPASSLVSGLLPNDATTASTNIPAQPGEVIPVEAPIEIPLEQTQQALPIQNVPLSPATDPLSGAMLTQLSQNADGTVGDQNLAAPAGFAASGTLGSRGKESLSGGLPLPTEIPLSALQAGGGAALEGQAVAAPEAGPASGGPVEVAPAKELEPEVEATQEKIANQKINTLRETVVAADTMPAVQPVTVSQPVVVLPLSEKGMQDGQKKSTLHSVRWLYEWCVRQIRKFSETLVVYRDKE